MYSIGKWLKYWNVAIWVKIYGVIPINNPFVVFKQRARADVLILVENEDAKILKTEPTQAPKVIDMIIINIVMVSLLPDWNATFDNKVKMKRDKMPII